MIGAFELVFDGNVSRGQVNQPARNEEGADAARALLLKQEGVALDALQAADAGADQDARAGLFIRGLGAKAGIGNGLVCGGHRIDDEIVDLALFLGLHAIVGIEFARARAARNHAADLAGNVGDIELRDPLGAVLAREQALPDVSGSASKGCDQTDAGDDDAPHALLES